MEQFWFGVVGGMLGLFAIAVIHGWLERLWLRKIGTYARRVRIENGKTCWFLDCRAHTMADMEDLVVATLKAYSYISGWRVGIVMDDGEVGQWHGWLNEPEEAEPEEAQ